MCGNPIGTSRPRTPACTPAPLPRGEPVDHPPVVSGPACPSGQRVLQPKVRYIPRSPALRPRGARMPATEDELKRALKAFKKRLKLTQLDEDSRLGHSPLTGARSRIVSIQPPAGFGRAEGEALAD